MRPILFEGWLWWQPICQCVRAITSAYPLFAYFQIVSLTTVIQFDFANLASGQRHCESFRKILLPLYFQRYLTHTQSWKRRSRVGAVSWPPLAGGKKNWKQDSLIPRGTTFSIPPCRNHLTPNLPLYAQVKHSRWRSHTVTGKPGNVLGIQLGETLERVNRRTS